MLGFLNRNQEFNTRLPKPEFGFYLQGFLNRNQGFYSAEVSPPFLFGVLYVFL